MLGLLQTAIVAAGRQTVAITLVSFVVWLLLSNRVPNWLSSPTVGATGIFSSFPIAQFLAWAFLLTATACALTRDRFVDRTADRIQKAARSMSATNPTLATKILLAHCLIGAVALAVLDLEGLRTVFSAFEQSTGDSELGEIFWAAAISLGVASLGSTAYACFRALH